jgi:hypothetical protein
MTRIKPLYWLAVPLVILTACSEVELLAPEPSMAERAALMTCTVVVSPASMTCKPVELVTPEGVQADRIIGGQDTYIKLASSNNAYDGGTFVFSTDVTLQNLVQYLIGTTDGSTVTGVKVFFQSAPIGLPSGNVTLANEDGQGTFTAASQDYFQYNEILSPYQISAARTWQFQLDASVTSFTFQVYVAATMVDESATPLLDKVWTGTNSTAWSEAANWQGGVVPDSGNVAAVPSDALLVSTNYPVLSADARVLALRVGLGSTLGLGGFQMTVHGNVDSPGAIQNGTLRMAGSGVKLSGNVPSLSVTGSTALQGATKSSGPIVVTGTLTVTNRTLTVSIP